MVYRIITSCALLISFFLLHENASAMECTQQDFDLLTKKAETIFTGEVLEQKFIEEEDAGSACWKHSATSPDCGGKTALLKVLRTWKESPGQEEVTVYSEDGCYCLGAAFKTGERYIVFAEKTPDVLKVKSEYSTRLCDGTVAFSEENTLAKETEDKLEIYFRKHQD